MEELLENTSARKRATDALVGAVSPSATDLIRMDHTKVLATFHRYRTDLPPENKRALAQTICLLIEIHAALEEEIFYPAMREANRGLIDKSVPEHDEMRRLMSALGEMDPASANFDDTVMALMRIVIHHVADEETMLLPDAERLLGERVKELGARMTARKIELGLPRLGEFASNAARAMPKSTIAMTAAAVVAGAYLLKRAFGGPGSR